MIIETKTPQETFEVGKKIGENARPGQIYTLTGDLGVGKTVFTQGVAAGLGITEGMDVVNRIAEEDTDYSDRPLDEQKIKSMTVDTFGVDYPEPEKC